VECSEALVAKLARFYSVMGNRPDEPGALALMAEILCRSATDDQIAQAMMRCARECRYPVRLSDFLQRIPGQEIPKLEAEARKDWDVLIQFVGKYVDNDVHGNYGPEHGWYPKTFPKLSDRLLDTVRRTGGWRVYKLMDEESFPFQQKRFFEEYQAWTAVERIDSEHMLMTPTAQVKQLATAKMMEQASETKPAQVPHISCKANSSPADRHGNSRSAADAPAQQAARFHNGATMPGPDARRT